MLNTERPLAAYRGLASRIYLPNPAEIEALGADYMPYAFVLFDGIVPSQQVGNGYTSQPEDCFITHLVASSTLLEDGHPVAGGQFALQIFDSQRQRLWMKQPINFANALGSAGEPFWLKRLYRLPAEQQLNCQVTNQSTSDNTIQVVAWGLRK